MASYVSQTESVQKIILTDFSMTVCAFMTNPRSGFNAEVDAPIAVSLESDLEHESKAVPVLHNENRELGEQK